MRFFHDMQIAIEPTDMGFCIMDEKAGRTWSFR